MFFHPVGVTFGEKNCTKFRRTSTVILNKDGSRDRMCSLISWSLLLSQTNPMVWKIHNTMRMNDLNEWPLQSKAQYICLHSLGFGICDATTAAFRKTPLPFINIYHLSNRTKQETIDFDYCIIAAGCNFGPFHKPEDSVGSKMKPRKPCRAPVL